MDPLTLLVFFGLVSLGALVVAAFAAAMACVALFALLFMITAVIAITGTIDDYFYNKKMLRKEAPYRLPWYYRWKGWEVGANNDAYKYQSGMFYDPRINQIVGMVRLTDRAFSERYGLGWHD